MRIRSVIGAGYGDEGKGLAVDALAHEALTQGEVTVIRVNGGAQAGHTVQTPDGRRHVFHQFGAGSLAGARTHWSRDFVASPMFWADERAALAGLGARVDAVSADPRVQVSTPWDVMINQALEEARGNAKHGSCGMGFGETVERAERGWGLLIQDLNGKDLTGTLDLIRQRWFPQRMAEHGLDPGPYAEAALNEGIMERFLEDCAVMRAAVMVVPDSETARPEFGALITEGAQGLGLDMTVGAFPHVTRSHTGLRNVVRFATAVQASRIDALYMTRAYATRHGAGPFPGEGDVSGWADVVDPTNAPNAWQGALRTGALDLDLMASRVVADEAAAADGRVMITRTVGVSCLDQLTGPARLIINGEERSSAVPEMEIARALGGEIRLVSTAPDRNGVRLSEMMEDRPESPAAS